MLSSSPTPARHIGSVQHARPRRVVHLVQTLLTGGMERVVSQLAGHVDPERFESHVLVFDVAGPFGLPLRERGRLHFAPPFERWSMLWPGALVAQLRQLAPDVVHSHGGVWYKATRAARAAGVRRLVHTEHGRPHADHWIHRALHRAAARRTSALVSVSDVLARDWAAGVLPDASRRHVIVNGVDTEWFRPRVDGGGLREELGLAPETPLIGSIGRLEHIKGYDVVIEAFALLRARWAGAVQPVLVLAGDGMRQGELEALARARAVVDGVRFIGVRDDVRPLHAAFTVFTMGSRSEGTSMSLLEAMSAGLCPVVTAVGGNAHVLGPSLVHRAVASERPDLLAGAWQHALADEVTRRRDGQLARERVREVFSLGAMVRAYERLYDDHHD